MRPLSGKGSFYVNLFAHYRPVDDPKWYLQDTPMDHIQPIIGLQSITAKGKAIKDILPYLSTSNEVANSGTDLLRWWQMTSPNSQKEEL